MNLDSGQALSSELNILSQGSGNFTGRNNIRTNSKERLLQEKNMHNK